MNDYRVIFQERAKDYHFAMQQFPNVRSNEFDRLIMSTDFSTIHTILDVPAGGGYLKKFVPSGVNVISTDFSEGFSNDNIEFVSPETPPRFAHQSPRRQWRHAPLPVRQFGSNHARYAIAEYRCVDPGDDSGKALVMDKQVCDQPTDQWLF